MTIVKITKRLARFFRKNSYSRFATKGKSAFWKWFAPVLGVATVLFASLDYLSTQNQLEKEKQLEIQNAFYQAMDLFGGEVKYGLHGFVQLNQERSEDFKNKQKRLEGARRLIEKIELISPKDKHIPQLRFIYYVLLDDLESAKNELRKFQEGKEQVTEANIHFMMGMLFSLNKKDNDKAMLLFERAVQLAPNDANGRIMFAFFLHTMNMNERAIQQLQRAIVLEPKNIAPLNALAHVLLESDKAEDARKILLDMVRRGVANGMTYNSLGLISADQNQHNTAIKYFMKAIEMAPHESFFHFNLSLSYAAIGQASKAAEAKKLAISYGFPEDLLNEKIPYGNFHGEF